jgi:hypothetical protein
MSCAPPLDLDALSLADLKKLVVPLLTRVAMLEEENQRLREEIARLPRSMCCSAMNEERTERMSPLSGILPGRDTRAPLHRRA